jgi:hypothetical protein
LCASPLSQSTQLFRSEFEVWRLMFKVDGFVKSHQRAPCGAPKSMTGNVSH